jgi:hypothetical protein
MRKYFKARRATSGLYQRREGTMAEGDEAGSSGADVSAACVFTPPFFPYEDRVVFAGRPAAKVKGALSS